MEEYSWKELQREQEYKNKYSSINANMERKLNDYNKNVLRNNLKKQIDEQLKEDNQVKEYKQKLENDYIKEVSQRNTQLMETNSVIQQQIQDKKHNGELNNQLFDYESQRMKDREMEIKNVDD